jgi:RNA polymerase sigma factor (sigma-70 family)
MEKRVLVVDDEAMIVDGLLSLLELENIEAAGAWDCDGAVAMISELFYPVILADLRLHTEAEGLRLLAAIRERTPESRVVVLTGYATPQVEEDLLASGVALVLRKPSTGDVIIDAINALLEEIEREAGIGEIDVEQLYLTLRHRLYAIPQKRFGLSPQVAEDVVHDAWLLFLRKRGLIRDVGPWLAGTVANLSRQQIDRRVRKREAPDGEDLVAAMPDHRGGSITDAIAIREALHRTDDRARTLCSLIAMEGFSYEEVSAATGIPLGSVGPLYIRAKKKIREILAN